MSFIARPAGARERGRMVLIDWRPMRSGALVGRATVMLPIGLLISDVGVFERDGSRWTQLPAQQLQIAGAPVLGANGKQRWVSPIRWSTSELQRRFSETVLELIDEVDGGER